ncbi:MAG: PQQ-dependent sugar dehydrogenase [Verrucomicrobiales bacterium]|nr:PQQ-dependent sugar dehydrogenase [Verrucomicrobiales bacterium]
MIRTFLYVAALSLSCLIAEERAPWTTSQISGSPVPPKPYRAEVLWPEITFDRACDIARLPSRDCLLITQQKGKIWILPDDLTTTSPEKKLFADFAVSHDPFDSVFSLAFHPDFERNREVYLFYRTSGKPLDDGTRISRFRVFPDRFELDPGTEEILLTFRSGGHNGGHLGFGPDGMLYILTGDSEVPSPPDPLLTGQDLTDLLSSVLRIDVNRRESGKTYAIPEDNPFLEVPDARPEIWAYGLRNPWKLCFHPETGDLWVGDVGWELWEMLYRVERGSNFGWSIIEGVQPILANQNPGPSPISPAAVLHPHTEFASITGGYVYEGNRLPDLEGRYLYGDFVTGQLWGLQLDGSEVVGKDFLADTRLQIVSFGQAANGEVIFLDWPTDQHLYRLVPNTVEDLSNEFPTTLSETGLFSKLESQEPSPGVYAFSIQGEMWHDGAEAKRWIAIPGEETLSANRSPFAIVPEDTVLAKTLERDGRKLETQILHYSQKQWQGYSYRWNEEQTDAELVKAEGETVEIDGKPWTFHSRTDCARCHNVGSDFRLAFHPGQLNRDGQLQRFQRLGLIDEAFAEKVEKQPTADPTNPAAPIDLRARTWLSANCAHCHRNRGGGSVALQMNLEAQLEATGLFDAVPEKGTFGIPEAKLLLPGDPYRSMLYYRSVTPGIGHMPMIGARTVDPTGEIVLHDWIASLETVSPPEPGIDDLPSALRLVHLLRARKITGAEATEWLAKGKASPNPMISGLFQDL